MLVGINFSNVHVLNIDEVIKKLEQFRDTIEDGSVKGGRRSRATPKPTLILDVVFYAEHGSVATLYSATGHSVKEYEDGDNEAIQSLSIFVDGSGDFSTEKKVFRELHDEGE